MMIVKFNELPFHSFWKLGFSAKKRRLKQGACYQHYENKSQTKALYFGCDENFVIVD